MLSPIESFLIVPLYIINFFNKFNYILITISFDVYNYLLAKGQEHTIAYVCSESIHKMYFTEGSNIIYATN